MRQHTLTRHLIHVHGFVVPPRPSLEISRDALDGSPICRHCGVEFISWQNLKHHITMTCPNLELSKAPPVVLAQRRRLLERIAVSCADTGRLVLSKRVHT